MEPKYIVVGKNFMCRLFLFNKNKLLSNPTITS